MTFRQTNVVWVCYFTALAVVNILSSERKALDISCRDLKTFSKSLLDIYDFFSNGSYKQNFLAQAANLAINLVTTAIRNIFSITRQLYVFVLAIVGFSGFLLWNGSIVLGDKSNHVAGLHFPQLFYFTSFLSAFAAPWLLTSCNINNTAMWILRPNVKKYLILVELCTLGLYFVHKHT